MQNPKLEVIILHDINGRLYFEAIDELKKNEKIRKLEYYEIIVFRKLFADIIKRRISLHTFKQFFKNLLFRLKVPFIKNKIIILGTAPLDFRIIYYSILSKKNKLIYHTSWPFWDRDRFPKKSIFLNKGLKKLWKSFLEKNNIEIVCLTNEVKKSLKKFANIKENKIKIISHCVNSINFYPRKYELIKEKLRLLYVGRLVKQKGLEIIKKLIEIDKGDKFIFTVIGEGEYNSELESVFEYDYVNYLGAIKNKKKLGEIFRENDIILVPSLKTENWEELFGLVIIEGMSSGVIPIATNHIGPREIINQGENGYLIEEKDDIIKNISDILFELYSNRNKLKKLKRNAVLKANKYEIKKISKKWEKILKGNNI